MTDSEVAQSVGVEAQGVLCSHRVDSVLFLTRMCLSCLHSEACQIQGIGGLENNTLVSADVFVDDMWLWKTLKQYLWMRSACVQTAQMLFVFKNNHSKTLLS